MLSKRFTRQLTSISLMSMLFCGCYHPPYNNFKPYNRSYKDMATGAAVGTAMGAVVGPTTLIGTGLGAVAFTAHGLAKETRSNIIKELQRLDIQFVQYGETMTLIVPTDRYYLFNSPHLNEICYPGLILVLKLLRFYPNSVIYVAGFTDNVGSRYHKKMLSQARAETMLTFLWANNIPAQRLHAEGYGDKHDISDNRIIHGSAQNRRVEIQWYNGPADIQPVPYIGATK